MTNFLRRTAWLTLKVIVALVPVASAHAQAAAMTVPPPPPPPDAPFCTPVVGDEAKAVAYLRGEYGVLGSRDGQPYTGKLRLSGAEDAASLEVSGMVDGTVRQGKAVYVRCGPDRVSQLEITWSPGNRLYCVPHVDYDNMNRASCTRRLSEPNGDQELWFQQLQF